MGVGMMFIPSRKERLERRDFLKAHPSLEKNVKVHGASIAILTMGGFLAGFYFKKTTEWALALAVAGFAVGSGAVYLHRKKLIKDDEQNSK